VAGPLEGARRAGVRAPGSGLIGRSIRTTPARAVGPSALMT
jgi:hypothetical protein